MKQPIFDISLSEIRDVWKLIATKDDPDEIDDLVEEIDEITNHLYSAMIRGGGAYSLRFPRPSDRIDETGTILLEIRTYADPYDVFWRIEQIPSVTIQLKYPVSVKSIKRGYNADLGFRFVRNR